MADSFTGITPVERVQFRVLKISSPNWVAGFVNGEGSFYVVIFKDKQYKTGYSVQLRFVLGQHSRDLLLIEKLVEFFGCGYLKSYSNKPLVWYTVTDINNIINVCLFAYN